MKKILSILFAVMLIAGLSVPVSAYKNTDTVIIRDDADFLTDEEEEKLFVVMYNFSDTYDICLEFKTTARDFSDSAVIKNAENTFDEDFGIDADGALFLIDSANGNWVDHFVLANGVDDMVSDKALDYIIYAVEDPIIDYDEYRAAILWVSWLDDIYSGENTYESKDYDFVNHSQYDSRYANSMDLEVLGFGIVFAIISGLITFGVIWSRYHQHSKPTAALYLDTDSINIYNRSDVFVREYTTRTYHSSGGSGGGGGGRHGGGHHGGGGSRGHR
ncbi:MAG: hypothetical protein LBM41_01900 [Ruminococcus sp.]|jgi:uncharacterized membrane protein YgcG|nr:hypothetical protein [Ruminococcus sp.]